MRNYQLLEMTSVQFLTKKRTESKKNNCNGEVASDAEAVQEKRKIENELKAKVEETLSNEEVLVGEKWIISALLNGYEILVELRDNPDSSDLSEQLAKMLKNNNLCIRSKSKITVRGTFSTESAETTNAVLWIKQLKEVRFEESNFVPTNIFFTAPGLSKYSNGGSKVKYKTFLIFSILYGWISEYEGYIENAFPDCGSVFFHARYEKECMFLWIIFSYSIREKLFILSP
ncbi:hypothetical protein [Bacillus cereus]|uniref:Uncharacterized protein n=1 Tax=Bacillus cereus TaxID=1396 RepID=A0A9X7B6K1_BACCE|nr:hypothetical protein [Bacillus cereus]PED43226.1 hypothetical protein CON26_15465 [Bacillus cereus]PFV01958.1 hypothetical protein COK98_28435 [Bacillus cereus]